MARTILEELSSNHKTYKGVKVNIFGLPVFGSFQKRTVRSTIDRLVRQELIIKELNGMIISGKGKEYLKRKADALKNFSIPKKVSSIKDLIVMFDVPLARKAEREWLRFHLKKFGFVMIQKSVWVGPSPLPKEFLDYIKSIKMEGHIKQLKLSKPYGK